jgi:hypothetical protein
MTTKNKKLEEFVFWEGTLKSLNAQNPEVQYEVVEKESFIATKLYDNPEWDKMKEEIARRGYEGLVLAHYDGCVNSCTFFEQYRILGLPIRRIKQEESK